MPDAVTYQEATELFEVLYLTAEPMGIYYSDAAPDGCLTPKEMETPSYEKEQRGEVDFRELFGNFTCIFQKIWQARKKKAIACFDKNHFGCLGGAFAMGYVKPQLDVIVRYVSTGIPGYMEGEHYLDSPEQTRKFFETVDPRPAPKPHLVFKPISLFGEGETPELVVFFDRPESISGLHQLASFITNDMDVVRSPWGAGCYNVVAWPLKYLERGEKKAALGAWDPSCRKFFRADEITFTVPYELYADMVKRWKESFLAHEESAWRGVRKRARRSGEKWGEEKPEWLKRE